MIDNDATRIIGDFLEVNADISYNEATGKGLKFIKKWRANKQRKKLVDMVTEFVKSPYILNRDNLYEAFVYFFNNRDIYTPKYLKVFKADEDKMENDRYEGVVSMDKINCLIHLESNKNTVDIVLQYNDPKGEFSKISITRDKLEDFSSPLSDKIQFVNTYLKAEIGDYIVKQIEHFEETKDND